MVTDKYGRGGVARASQSCGANANFSKKNFFKKKISENQESVGLFITCTRVYVRVYVYLYI